uniref:Clp ATPase C-terminal domain-containing protein n=1 Tax=Chlamydomonas leiostraca TaxID=1034604 RepID=A0A7S0R4R9_9CHLO
MQGRLPIRVELRGLTRDDFHRILTEPQANLIKQQQALMETEGVELKFTESAIAAIAEVAEAANRMLDNIGARRLHTVIERVLADISFNAPEKAEEARRAGNPMYTYVVDEAHVRKVMTDLLQKQDLSRYVL